MLHTGVTPFVPSAEDLIKSGETVVDVGCFGWKHAERCKTNGATLIGVDLQEPPGKPEWAGFATSENGIIGLASEKADVVIASHVIEHILEPMRFMQEIVRITKPGGVVLLEAPSELSAIPKASDNPEDHSFHSFWDDPTHIRPWTPGAMYRLALSCRMFPLAIARGDTGNIPTVTMLAQKPQNSHHVERVRYTSLRDVTPGLKNAWHHVWEC